MKTPVLIISISLVILTAGCGPSKAEREATERERQRLELERRAEQERRIGNEALSEVGSKLGRKPPSLDLGVPVDPEKQPAPEPEKSVQP